MRQQENLKIVDPFRLFLTHERGWHCEKTHGNEFQEGFPDLRIMHPKYEPKWVECKILHGSAGSVSFTSAQKNKFPKWIMYGEKIWVIAGNDFRGEAGRAEMLAAYDRLFRPPNAYMFLNPSMRGLR
jgi:hypothetical protein